MLKPEHPPGTTSPGRKDLGPLAAVTDGRYKQHGTH